MKRYSLIYSFIVTVLSIICISACNNKEPQASNPPKEEIIPEEIETVDLDYGVTIDANREADFYGAYSLN